MTYTDLLGTVTEYVLWLQVFVKWSSLINPPFIFEIS